MARITSPLLMERSASPEWKGKPIFDVCLCYRIDPEGRATPENLLCYAEGCIGALSNSQDKLCRHMNILPTPPALEVHLKKFSMMGDIMHVCMKEKTEEDFYKCIDSEASKKVAKLEPPKPVKEKPVRKEAGVTREKPKKKK